MRPDSKTVNRYHSTASETHLSKRLLSGVRYLLIRLRTLAFRILFANRMLHRFKLDRIRW